MGQPVSLCCLGSQQSGGEGSVSVVPWMGFTSSAAELPSFSYLFLFLEIFFIKKKNHVSVFPLQSLNCLLTLSQELCVGNFPFPVFMELLHKTYVGPQVAHPEAQQPHTVMHSCYQQSM